MLTNVVSRVISEIAKERLVIYLGKNESAKLARLVNIAKGSDRSIREYARVSQVNVSTISRTINGEYTPGIKVLQKLTSPEAEPRGGVTFQDLVDAANMDKTTTLGYTLGLLASGMLMGPMRALAAGAMGLGVMYNSRNVKEEKETKNTEGNKNTITAERFGNFQRKLYQFSAISTGVIYGHMVQKGIRFRPGTAGETECELNENDIVAFIEDADINEWIFSFWGLSDEDIELNGFLKKTAPNLFTQFFLFPANVKRKISLVVNNEELYGIFMGYKDKNSFKGNVSVIFVDEKQVRVVKEEYIAYYDTEMPESNLTVV